jgi:hypothetical protein
MFDPELHVEVHQSRWVDWPSLSSDERQKRINKSRNYIRYKLIKGLTIETALNTVLTPEEKMLINLINDNKQAIDDAKFALLRHFYDNCPKVGSTLKRKMKPKLEPNPDPFGLNDLLND